MKQQKQLSEEEIQKFHSDGFLIIRQLFSEQEIAALLHNFMTMNGKGAIPDCFTAISLEAAKAAGDILKAYPRMMNPHKVNELALKYLLDERVSVILTALLQEEPIAMQSMVYFKPPGAKGQALHQDNYYLKVEPGTCIAAWTALDAADEENGGLFVVPNSHRGDIQCPHEADSAQSFTREEVDIPIGLTPTPTDLNAGDVLFFNGNVIHGSYPNQSKERFRRAFISHYAPISAQKVSEWYDPLYTMDGKIVERETNTSNGPCGNEFSISGPH
ncbi:MAG: phytanoyl-CoA dioxygenase [Bacilli bacterium]|nr:phytanoyl-CoA dioxygenase [Bacilli bacterium]